MLAYEPVVKEPVRVTVEPYEVVRPYLKPREVVMAPPRSVRVSFIVTEFRPIEVAAWTVTVGEHADVVTETIEP